MFSQVSVCPQGGGVHPPGQTPPWQADRHLWAGTPLPWANTPPSQTATAADGTHPTGMHSCFTGSVYFKRNLFFKKIWRTLVLFVGSLIPLFWTSGDVGLWFESQAGFPLGLENLENLEKWEGIFQSGKSQGILNRLEKSGKSQGKSHKILEKLGNLE